MADISAIFIFAVNCASCEAFKPYVYQEVKKLLIEKGVKSFSIKEYLAPSVLIGLSVTSAPKALHSIGFFPSLILIPTRIFDNITSYTLQQIAKVMVVMNGEVDANCDIKMKVVSDFMSVESYKNFFESYLSSQKYTLSKSINPAPVTYNRPVTNMRLIKPGETTTSRSGIRIISSYSKK